MKCGRKFAFACVCYEYDLKFLLSKNVFFETNVAAKMTFS